MLFTDLAENLLKSGDEPPSKVGVKSENGRMGEGGISCHVTVEGKGGMGVPLTTSRLASPNGGCGGMGECAERALPS